MPLSSSAHAMLVVSGCHVVSGAERSTCMYGRFITTCALRSVVLGTSITFWELTLNHQSRPSKPISYLVE